VTTVTPTYTRIAFEPGVDMWICAEHVDGRDDTLVLRPERTCHQCGRATVNWATRMVPKALGGIVDECDTCRAHGQEQPLPIGEEAS
jgi:hypothetical protein